MTERRGNAASVSLYIRGRGGNKNLNSGVRPIEGGGGVEKCTRERERPVRKREGDRGQSRVMGS